MNNYAAVTGKVKNTSTGWDVYTLIYGIWSGQQQNLWIYSTENDEEPVDIVADVINMDVYILCKSTDSTGKNNILILKYSQAGGFRWAKSFDSLNENDIPVSIDFKFNSNNKNFLYLTSYSYTIPKQGYDILTQKIDTAGNFIWSSYYNDSLFTISHDIPVKIISTDNSNFAYIAGTSTDSSDYSQTVLLKYDSSGNLLWKQNFGTGVPRNNFAKAMDFKNNKIALGGVIDMGNHFNYLTLLYNTDGNLQWSQIYNGPGDGDDNLSDIVFDQTDNVYVTGSSYVDSLRKNDYCTVKYLQSGDTAWVNFYNGAASGNDSAVAMITDNFNCVFVTGKSEEMNGYYAYGSVLYNTSGWSHWTRKFQLPQIPGDNIPVEVSKHSFTNSFLISGTTTGDSLNSFSSIYYAGVIDGIDDNNSLNAGSYKLNQNYPNPFNPRTKINYELHVTSGDLVTLKVFNVLGNEVATLVNEKQNSGRYSVEFDGSNFSRGVYFYKLSANGISTTMKMLLVK